MSVPHIIVKDLNNIMRWGESMYQSNGQYCLFVELKVRPQQVYGNGGEVRICDAIGVNQSQWSRSKPSYEFHFEGLSNFSSSVNG